MLVPQASQRPTRGFGARRWCLGTTAPAGRKRASPATSKRPTGASTGRPSSRWGRFGSWWTYSPVTRRVSTSIRVRTGSSWMSSQPPERPRSLLLHGAGLDFYALYFGARVVTFVDTSAQALDLCRENARLNGLAGGAFVRADAFNFLKSATEEYELIVLDPPSFIKSKKKLREGEKGYIDLHKKALKNSPAMGTSSPFPAPTT